MAAKKRASPLRRAAAGEGGYLFLPRNEEDMPSVVQLRHKTLDDFYKKLDTTMVEPIRMPGWPMGIGLLGDEEARYSRLNSGLNPWLQGNGITWDVRGALLVVQMNGLGPLNADQMEWALANVVKRDGTLHGLRGCTPC